MERVVAVLVGGEHEGGRHLHVAHLGAYYVAVGLGIVLDFGADIFGGLQVGRRQPVQVVEGFYRGFGNGEARRGARYGIACGDLLH